METMERTRYSIDSERIRRKFDRACLTYDEAAVAQQQIARHLSAIWEVYQQKHRFRPATALEIGCGTGGFTRYLQQSCASASRVLQHFGRSTTCIRLVPIKP